MVQLDGLNEQVPMRQQQTGMYWQRFILTEILTLHLEKVGDRQLIAVPSCQLLKINKIAFDACDVIYAAVKMPPRGIILLYV